jgi:hypothetical protein
MFTMGVAYDAAAVEGAVQYPHGAEGFMAGALPPPGTYLLAYGIHYAGVRKDDRGDNVTTPAGDKVELQVNAIALRAVHMTDIQLLGAQLGMHAIVPFFDNVVTIGGRSDTATNLGDVTFAPAILAWHRPTVHWAVAVDVMAPTGAYDRQRALGNNVGAHYWSFEPLAAVTWMPGAGWEVDTKAMYNLKTTNTATSYRSGDELHMDWAVGKSIGDAFKLGLSGYADWQLQNDRANGVDVPDGGNRARYLAVGPELAYQTGGTSLVAKWQNELVARNAFQGGRVILKLVTAF